MGKHIEDIFLAAQLRLLFPLGTTSQNNIQKSFIRQKEPAMVKKNNLYMNRVNFYIVVRDGRLVLSIEVVPRIDNALT